MIDEEWVLPWSGYQEGHGWVDLRHGAVALPIKVVGCKIELGALRAGEPFDQGSLRDELAEFFAEQLLEQSVPLVEFLKQLWLAKKPWILRQLLWWLLITLDRGFVGAPGITNPLKSPRAPAGPGCRQDVAVLQAAVCSPRAHQEYGTAKGRQESLHPLAHLPKGSGTHYDADVLFLRKYQFMSKELLKNARHLHIAADSSRVGGQNIELNCLFNSDLEIGCWGPTQVPIVCYVACHPGAHFAH